MASRLCSYWLTLPTDDNAANDDDHADLDDCADADAEINSSNYNFHNCDTFVEDDADCDGNDNNCDYIYTKHDAVCDDDYDDNAKEGVLREGVQMKKNVFKRALPRKV